VSASVPTAGRLLIAEPMLGDPNFDRTVILVIEHHDEGALGLVLNRPTEIEVADALPAWVPLAAEPAVLHLGGPVDEQTGWCLGRAVAPHDLDDFVPLVGDLGLVDLSEDPDRLAPHLHSVRLYAGYSGWGAGQLDDELTVGAWFVVDAHPSDPFHRDGRELWRRILARQPADDLRRLALFPPDPSVN
jgi:putative transcriptional regulator